MRHQHGCLCRDSSLFPYFLEFIKTGGEAEESQLLKELTKIDQFLDKSEGNFFGGTDVNALDMQIAPKLKHISIGAKAVHVRVILYFTANWTLPYEAALFLRELVVDLTSKLAKALVLLKVLKSS